MCSKEAVDTLSGGLIGLERKTTAGVFFINVHCEFPRKQPEEDVSCWASVWDKQKYIALLRKPAAEDVSCWTSV